MTITNSEVVGKFVEEDVDEVVGVVVGEEDVWGSTGDTTAK